MNTGPVVLVLTILNFEKQNRELVNNSPEMEHCAILKVRPCKVIVPIAHVIDMVWQVLIQCNVDFFVFYM